MTYAIERLDPLVLIDPVDGKRNVAAAMSAQKYWELVDGCRRFLESPNIEFFNSKKTVEPLTLEELTDFETKRGTRFVIIKGTRQPGIHDDILYPQLRKVEKSALASLDKAGFRTFKSDVYADETSFSFVFEMDVLELPNIKRVLGPPLKMRDACKNYRDLYPNAYVYGDRLATTVDREYVHAELFLFDGLTNGKFGNVPSGDACKESINEAFNDEFGRFMRTFLRE
jgi:tRNA nucleotidyltransferase (CCA-adding enzyme)